MRNIDSPESLLMKLDAILSNEDVYDILDNSNILSCKHLIDLHNFTIISSITSNKNQRVFTYKKDENSIN